MVNFLPVKSKAFIYQKGWGSIFWRENHIPLSPPPRKMYFIKVHTTRTKVHIRYGTVPVGKVPTYQVKTGGKARTFATLTLWNQSKKPMKKQNYPLDSKKYWYGDNVLNKANKYF